MWRRVRVTSGDEGGRASLWSGSGAPASATSSVACSGLPLGRRGAGPRLRAPSAATSRGRPCCHEPATVSAAWPGRSCSAEHRSPVEAAPPGTRPLDARVAPSGMTAEHVSVRGRLRVASRRVCADPVPDVGISGGQLRATGRLLPPPNPALSTPSSSPTSQVRNKQPGGEGTGPRVPRRTRDGTSGGRWRPWTQLGHRHCRN